MEKSPGKMTAFVANLLCLIPAAVILAIAFASGRLANPIPWATQRLGDVALILLLVTLAFRPLAKMIGWRAMPGIRRIVGWYVVKYALLHLFMLVGIDYQFRFTALWADIRGKPYIWIGTAALILLFVTGFATFKILTGKPAPLRRILSWAAYPAGLLAVLHFFLVRKGNLFSLQGDLLLPSLSAIIFITIMSLRIPWIESRISRLDKSGN